MPLAAVYARSRWQRRPDANAGISRPDAERAAAKRVDSSKPAAKSGPDQYSRDRMRLLDVKGLEKRACECYGSFGCGRLGWRPDRSDQGRPRRRRRGRTR